MVIFSKTKSHPKTVVNFESILESVKSNEGFCSKCCQSGNLAKRLHTNNQQECMVISKQEIKMSVSVKNVVAITFMCQIIEVFHL